ncbi:MAG: TRAP transporter substrate-binding protein DctP [Verrucomicrobiae bacterium]|nr:TRAP transporter substrate-binding protein DctP [Verrucomicrobiae bacterium]
MLVLRQEAATFKIATVAPRGTTFHNHLEELNAQWKRAPGEPVDMNIYAGTQGGEVSIVKRMRINQLQGAMLTAVGLSQIDESVTALQLMPMQFQMWEEVDYVRTALEERLEQIFLDKGYVVLFWGDAGWVRFFSKERVYRIGDFKTLRVGTNPGQPKATEVLKNYYTPVILDPDKMLLALKNGMIDAVPAPPFLANAIQLATEAHYMLDLKWAPVVGAMVVTERAWKQLPEQTRKYLKETARDRGAKIRETSRLEDEQSIQAMVEKQGLIVDHISEADYADWMKVVDENQPKIRGNIVPDDVYDQVMYHLSEYRSSLAVQSE